MRSSRGTRTTRALNRMVGAGVAGVAVVAVLVGCTSERGPEPSAPETTVASTAEPTPTPTPTPTELVAPETVKPERPDAMDTVEGRGAEATATYYMSLFAYAHATGDLSEWRSLSHPECVFCTNVIAGVEDLQERGHHVEGGVGTSSGVRSTEVDPGKWWLVTFTLDEDASTTVDKAGTVVDESQAGRYKIDIAVVREDDDWLIREFSHTDLNSES